MFFVQVERLLIEQNRLRAEKTLLEEHLALKEKTLRLQEMASTQNKVGDPDARRVQESSSVALNQIYTDSRQEYEISSNRKGKQNRSNITLIKLTLFSAAERADSTNLVQVALERSA